MIYVFSYVLEVAAGVAIGIGIYAAAQFITNWFFDKIRGV